MKTFSEDPLRMLRAIRFQVKLNFRLSERVNEALQRPEICSRLSIVARSRFQQEIVKAFETNPLAACAQFERFWDLTTVAFYQPLTE